MIFLWLFARFIRWSNERKFDRAIRELEELGLRDRTTID